MSEHFSDTDHKMLVAILDLLIPANADRGIPGAGELGVARFLSNVAAQNTAFAETLAALLSRAQDLAGEVTPDLVRQLETERPTDFQMLLSETYKGYYSRPDMRAKVGVAALPVHPKGYDVPRETPEIIDTLTAPVRARGPVYRDPTGGES